MICACPYCRWSLPEPDPSEYPDTEQGRDSLDVCPKCGTKMYRIGKAWYKGT